MTSVDALAYLKTSNDYLALAAATTVESNRFALERTAAVETTVALDGSGRLAIMDSNGGASNDTLTLTLNGANLRINDPANTLGGSGAGVVQVNANTVDVPLAGITGGLTIDTLAGTDTVNLNATLALGNGDLLVTARTINVNAAVSVSGNASINLNARQQLFVNTGANLTTANGNLTLNANQGATSTSGDYAGLTIQAVLRATGAGNITLNGRGGPNGDSNHGVVVAYTTSKVQSASGAITINGRGGGNSGGWNYGVLLYQTTITNTTGAIQVVGAGGDYGGRNVGLYIESTVINSSGSGPAIGNLTLQGTGGTPADGDNFGVQIRGSSRITSVDGDLTIIGAGGANSTNNGWGVFIENNGTINSTGVGANAATITITGTAPSGNGAASLFFAWGGATINTVDGALTINGISTSTGIDLRNVASNNIVFWPAKLYSTGSGAITINGSSALATDFVTLGSDTVINSGPADLTLRVNTIALVEGSLRGNGKLLFAPRTAGTSIGIGGGSGTLNVDDGLLSRINDGFSSITIGTANSGPVDINTATFRDPVTIVGSVIRDRTGADIAAVTNAVTLVGAVAPGQSPGLLNVTGNVALAANATFAVEIGGITPGEGSGNHDQVKAIGLVTLGSGVTLNLSAVNGYSPTAGASYRLIDNDGSDGISGSFSGLPEGATIANFLGSSHNATISYQGGDGNDVVITVNAPKLAVQGNGVTIANGDTTPTPGDHTDFDAVNMDSSLLRTFTVQNVGNAPLTIQSVTITGAQAGEFRLTTPPATSVAAGGQTTVGITFVPGALGGRSATITINSNALLTPAYSFAVQGRGSKPALSVVGNNQAIASGSTTPSAANGTDFGETTSAAVVHSFTLRNPGNGALLLSGTPLVAVSGPNATDFVVTQPATSSVAAGASAAFQLTFTPGGGGVRTATITIASNADGTPLYTFAVQGVGLSPTLRLPTLERVVVNDGKLRVPVQFSSSGYAIGSLGFAVSYDPACLSIAPTDANGDGLPDAITGLEQLPADFVTSVSNNANAHLLEVALYDNVTPISTLSDRTLFTTTFTVAPACLPAPNTTRPVTVGFAGNPAPSFGDTTGKDVVGTTSVGAITMYAEAKPTALLLDNNQVTENSAVGTTVGVFTSRDSEPSATFSYSLVSGAGSDDNASFTLATDTLQTAASFDYESKRAYTIRVRTTDNYGGSLEASFTISVTNSNEAPTTLALSNNSVAENQALGTTVGAFTTTDPDSGDSFLYTLVSGAGSADNADFALVNGLLTTNASFDYETKNSYTLRVRATDQGGLFTEQNFTITVTNVSEAPTGIINGGDGPSSDNSQATFDVNENSANGTTVATLAPANPDNASSYSYALVSGTGSADNASFTFVDNLLKLNTAVDYETKSSYTIRVRITDNGGQFVEQSLVIAVNDVNEAPTALVLHNDHVAENSPLGTAIATFATTDTDTDETFTYSLVTGAGSEDNASFTIVNDTLKTAVALDYETKPSYTLRVRSTDQRGAYLEQSFTITVDNVVEIPTGIANGGDGPSSDGSNTTFDVNENVAADTIVATFAPVPVEANQSYTYTLVSGDGSTDNASFTIVNGVLKTNAPLDYETKTSYTIRVRITDSEGYSAEQVLTIHINDRPDSPPVAMDDLLDPRTTVFRGGVPGEIAVLVNDVLHTLGTTLSIASITQPSQGSATFSPLMVTYTAPTSGNGNATFTYQATDGSLTSNSATVSLNYVANHTHGDCNGNGNVAAADFIAIVLEIFDANNAKYENQPAWWLTYTGDYAGSPLGCDANNSRNGANNSSASITAADIICTVLLFFGHTCGTGLQAASADQAASLTVAAVANGGQTTMPVTLKTGGQAVAAAAFALTLGDSAFDATDANGDGLPDAVTLNVPAGVTKAVVWNAQRKRLEVALYGASLPLPTLSDGVLATVTVDGVATPTLTQVSLSDANGNDLLAPTRSSLFLPLIAR